MELQAKQRYVQVCPARVPFPYPYGNLKVCLGKWISYIIDDLQQLKNMSVHGCAKLPEAILQRKLNLLLIYRQISIDIPHSHHKTPKLVPSISKPSNSRKQSSNKNMHLAGKSWIHHQRESQDGHAVGALKVNNDKPTNGQIHLTPNPEVLHQFSGVTSTSTGSGNTVNHVFCTTKMPGI